MSDLDEQEQAWSPGRLVYSKRLAARDLTVEFEREEDGRWIAEIPDLPGVLAYGTTPDEAGANVLALAESVLARANR